MKILYCSDFSDAALYSLEKALPFLEPACEADIISVIEAGYEYVEVYKHNKIENLEKIKQYLETKGLRVRKTFCPAGEPAEEILRQSQKGNYDLLITGSRREFWVKWLGSTSRKIVSKSHTPVFIARKTEKIIPAEAAKHVLFAVDGTENSRNSIRKAPEILDFTGSTIEILYVKQGKESLPVEITSDKEWLGRILEAEEKNAREIIDNASLILAQRGLKTDSKTVLEGDPATKIIEYSQSPGKDLVIMGTHGREGFSSLLLGSVSKRVLDNTYCPVIILPTRRD